MHRNVKSRYFKQHKVWILLVSLVIGLLGGAFLLVSLMNVIEMALLCKNNSLEASSLTGEELLLNAIRHYATTKVVPQQSFIEISITFEVLRSLGRPANFLVFGLGHDSLMWTSLNPRGTTLFLEEDPQWVQTILKNAPYLNAHMVKYRTKLSEANELIKSYLTDQECFTKNNLILRGNTKCKLALDMLPNEVYDKEWDLIMIDAPRGYFPEAPGRMAAIFSAAVMARNRRSSGVTHVFLHDVDRPVENTWGDLILCKKYLVKSVGRLWHFEIPPSSKMSNNFC
ncbi:hypothetical protein LIER_05572 [Lithospermum erythrorhizon]|uniref:Polysaccharide biosynthesis domain-containing protein n=1 Tax=Lithospermum erythrorhizon TaxID=34254 RepID=A0AAV3P0Z0_LITER